MHAHSIAFLILLAASSSTMAIDLRSLWDYGDPETSEQRFRRALERAEGDDVLILQTQIARTYGLRKDFDSARKTLSLIDEPAIGKAGSEARIRYHLELGRTFVSSIHRPEEMTPDAKASAWQAYDAGLGHARATGLDDLAIDAIHMLAFLDTAPADQLRWGQMALALVQSSNQPEAKRWEPSVRNNIGCALNELGRHEEALIEFQHALVLRKNGTNAEAIRVAHWMVARTLRSLHRFDEALAIQLGLERETEAAGKPDPYVFEELAALYKALGNPVRAKQYESRQRAADQK
jgi:tetratricopeptide (TPR) repeat protein